MTVSVSFSTIMWDFDDKICHDFKILIEHCILKMIWNKLQDNKTT
jgi:hypothetical protein